MGEFETVIYANPRRTVLDAPTDFAKEVNKVIFPFIWNFKPDKIKRNTLTGPISKGGLSMVNFADVEKSLKAAWVNRYCIIGGRFLTLILKNSEVLFCFSVITI